MARKVTAAEIADAKKRGFNLASWATVDDYNYTKNKAIDPNKSAAEQNWGADSRVPNPYEPTATPFDDGVAGARGLNTQAVSGGLGVAGAGTLTPEQRRYAGMLNAGRSAGVNRPLAPPEIGGLVGSIIRPQQPQIGRPGGPGTGAGSDAMVEALRAGLVVNTPPIGRPGGPGTGAGSPAMARAFERSVGQAAVGVGVGLLNTLLGKDYVTAHFEQQAADRAAGRIPEAAPYQGGGLLGLNQRQAAAATSQATAEDPMRVQIPVGTPAASMGNLRDLERYQAGLLNGEMDPERPGRVSPWYSTRSVPDAMIDMVAQNMDRAIAAAGASGDLRHLPTSVTDMEAGLLASQATTHDGRDVQGRAWRDPQTGKVIPSNWGEDTAKTLTALGYEYQGPGIGWILKPPMGPVASYGWTPKSYGGGGGGGGYGRYGSGSEREQGIQWRIGIT